MSVIERKRRTWLISVIDGKIEGENSEPENDWQRAAERRGKSMHKCNACDSQISYVNLERREHMDLASSLLFLLLMSRKEGGNSSTRRH